MQLTFALQSPFDESLEQCADIFIPHTTVATLERPCLTSTILFEITTRL